MMMSSKLLTTSILFSWGLSPSLKSRARKGQVYRVAEFPVLYQQRRQVCPGGRQQEIVVGIYKCLSGNEAIKLDVPGVEKAVYVVVCKWLNVDC